MPTITQAQLELRVGAGTVALYCCDDGTGVASSTVLAEILGEAEDEGSGLLGPGFTNAQVVLLLQNDLAVRGAFLDIAADLMSRRRPALVDGEGRTPYSAWRKRAEAVLERAGQAQVRFKGEAQAGQNAGVFGVSSNVDPPAFTFLSTTDKPGGGGF